MLKNKRFRFDLWLIPALLVSVYSCTTTGPAWKTRDIHEENRYWIEAGNAAVAAGMSQLSVSAGDRDILVLTNAGYGMVDELSTEIFLDQLVWQTGCTQGSRTLLPVQSSFLDPLWFAFYQKESGQLFFCKWIAGEFQQQVFDASPDSVLIPENWKSAAEGIIASEMFKVVSLFLTWAVEPPWSLLKSAAFHDHFCPGVNAGYIVGRYVSENLPLREGDKYIFVTAPGICPADALQVMFNATAGKGSGYTMAMENSVLADYEKEGIRPVLVAMRVNGMSDTCDGSIIGFDWNRAYAETNVAPNELSPPGGSSNPLFWISRVKMSRELVLLPRDKVVSFVVDLYSFSGDAALASEIAAGNPYAVIRNKQGN